MIAPDEWQAGFPNKQCSDQERYATAYHKGKLISVPIFDRLPLVCVSGNVPKMSTAAGFCFKNSQLDGKGGCRCKNGFEDALNPKFNLLAHAKAEGVDNLPVSFITLSLEEVRFLRERNDAEKYALVHLQFPPPPSFSSLHFGKGKGKSCPALSTKLF